MTRPSASPQPKVLLEARQRADRLLEQAFDRARRGTADPARLAELVFGRGRGTGLGDWRWPRVRAAAQLADHDVTLAVRCVGAAIKQHGVVTVPTGFASFANLRLDLSGAADGAEAPDFAPLSYLCVEPLLHEGVIWLVSEYHAAVTRGGRTQPHDLHRADERALLERLNLFLGTEHRLWELARLGGFPHPAPYKVRHFADRLLWGPQIAGEAFCLRCGELITFGRAARNGRRVPVCGACIRAGGLEWPAHAIVPHDRGRWWLKCAEPSCPVAFVGRSQARYCERHRSSRITPRHRRATVRTT